VNPTIGGKGDVASWGESCCPMGCPGSRACSGLTHDDDTALQEGRLRALAVDSMWCRVVVCGEGRGAKVLRHNRRSCRRPDLIDSCQTGWRIESCVGYRTCNHGCEGPAQSQAKVSRSGAFCLLRWRVVSPGVFSQDCRGGGAGAAGGGRRQANACGSRPNLGRPKRLAGPAIRKCRRCRGSEAAARSRGPSSRHISSL
jgi:hypothetical protein